MTMKYAHASTYYCDHGECFERVFSPSGEIPHGWGAGELQWLELPVGDRGSGTVRTRTVHYCPAHAKSAK